MINEKLIPSTIARKSYVDEQMGKLNKETIIYENKNGTSDTITFEKDISSIDFFKITYSHQGLEVSIFVPNGNGFTINSICKATETIVQQAFVNYKIENNKFIVEDGAYINFENNAVKNMGFVSQIGITKVTSY